MPNAIKIALKLLLLMAVTAGLALAMYWLFIRKPPSISEPTPPGDETTGGGLPQAGAGEPGGGGGAGAAGGGTGTLPPSAVADGGVTSVVTLTSAGVTSPTVTSTGRVAYYDQNDGRFYTINNNGNVEALSSAQFSQAQNVTFAPETDAVVVEFPDGSNIVYNFSSGQQVSMPNHWEGFSFAANGTEIAGKSIGSDPSNRTLIVTAADGSNTRVLAALGANDKSVDVNWSPNGEIIGFSKTGGAGSAFGQNQVFMIDKNGQDAGMLLVNGSNFKAKWSPDGSHLLYSVADGGDGFRSSLWFSDTTGDSRGGVRVRVGVKTAVDKCTFASASVAYCAVPTDMPTGGGITPALVTAPDNVYKIELPSGRASLLAIPAVETRMTNLSVSADGSELYYTDDRGRLNYLRLR